MNIVIIAMIVLAAGAVVYALVKGLIAFANMEPDDVDAEGITASHKKQNQMMFARVKYQAIAVILVALLLLMAGGQT
ncbi:Hypoxia induced protein conserved region [Parasphingorhabdus marina DSM 22363]|uniref:Hypoxia induced protein conserved region n=1 Tax=Parasphingorhabdus marina DSM 22363 TaxID=1123272 RepID=A0A1N6CXV7_9SPHN|nr:HIG1 domain-containing protein [Parasphingorhabdus marina]SIN63380.1 Hypoxia induced protein conserved region [Parasphingorhabdus marina DSM 22363]